MIGMSRLGAANSRNTRLLCGLILPPPPPASSFRHLGPKVRTYCCLCRCRCRRRRTYWRPFIMNREVCVICSFLRGYLTNGSEIHLRVHRVGPTMKQLPNVTSEKIPMRAGGRPRSRRAHSRRESGGSGFRRSSI